MTATNGHNKTNGHAEKLTRSEMRALVDQQARRYLHMTGAEFVEAAKRGDPLPEHPVVAHLLLLTGVRVPASE